ncbi:hypothetical protein GCM10022295_78540 [Streptomyces osmaniensis]|uniref:Uncharacterized protein n=1 Tax=Streptomyces osmaniensis TaxID=593134 RepID=A0ABP6YME3_9ACTN
MRSRTVPTGESAACAGTIGSAHVRATAPLSATVASLRERVTFPPPENKVHTLIMCTGDIQRALGERQLAGRVNSR